MGRAWIDPYLILPSYAASLAKNAPVLQSVVAGRVRTACFNANPILFWHQMPTLLTQIQAKCQHQSICPNFSGSVLVLKWIETHYMLHTEGSV